ncbi:MAG: DNA-binding response regulator [Anaerolineaceae bacterium 4572_78]|nr:MAG: DNA-binding response regulator [Anaerolineaceae bacterium 4572_78]
MSEKILIIEDDNTLSETLAYNLTREGYNVLTTLDGSSGLLVAREQSPDLVILDVLLPGLDGLSICRILRREMDTPIIMLTARSGEMDKIIGLDSGADDYITKPFSLGEFLARVRVALRRRDSQITPNRLVAGDLVVDLVGRKIELKKKIIQLSNKEFDLLVELIKNVGIVLSRDLLLTKVWGYDYVGETRTVDVHIRWLRGKIEEDPSSPEHILTVRGIGYKFEY